MDKQQFPTNYKPLMDQMHTEKAIKFIKDTFESELSSGLYLSRVTSPLFVPKGSGINDDLNGIERPVTFPVLNMDNSPMEIVHLWQNGKEWLWLTINLNPIVDSTPI